MSAGEAWKVCFLGLSPTRDPERNMPATFSGPTHVIDLQDALQKKSHLFKIACLQPAGHKDQTEKSAKSLFLQSYKTMNLKKMHKQKLYVL